MGHSETSESESADARVQPPVAKKSRRTLSCLSCQKRKVKCDRVKPCRACCIRGVPAECEYGTKKHDRGYIEQSDLIEELRAKVAKLEQKLAEVDGATSQQISTAKNGFYSEINALKVRLVPLDTRKTANLDQKTTEASSLSLALAAPASPQKFLIEVFVGEVIQAFGPDPTNINGRVFDLRSAAESRISSPLLSAGFDAMALIFVGQRDQNPKFLIAGNINTIRR